MIYDQAPNQGGLGNQLFKIAFMIGQASRCFDTYAINEWKYSEQFPNVPIKKDIITNANFTEQQHEYVPAPLFDNNQITQVDGYFQSYKYFKKSENEVRHAFLPANGVLTEAQLKFAPYENIRTTSIHVRRGDYVLRPDYHRNISETSDYYKHVIFNKTWETTDLYLVFSDDITFCKTYFKGYKYEFIENNSNVIDMIMMSKCNNNIIANSSFSWWAAWLNKHPNKKVYYPRWWFGEKYSHKSIKDLCPEEWCMCE